MGQDLQGYEFIFGPNFKIQMPYSSGLFQFIKPLVFFYKITTLWYIDQEDRIVGRA